jgi:hypothetical protein
MTTQATSPSPLRRRNSVGSVTSISGATSARGPERELLEATDLVAWNAAMRGDSDVLPWLTEFRLLRSYTSEVAAAVWANEYPPAVEEVVVPLSRETHRYAHMLGVPTYLRLFGPVVALADRLEARRVPPSIATSARYAPNRSRARILRPRSLARWEEGLARIAQTFPLVLRMDLATFFPSLTPDVLGRALGPCGTEHADAFLNELARTGIRGLPVGSVPARLVAEAVLHPLDVALQRLERMYVRGLDDLAIGVASQEDAEALVVQVAAAVRPLELNKSKTKVMSTRIEPGVPVEQVGDAARALLADRSPDRAQLARALAGVRLEAPGWEQRKRQRWLKLLVDAAVRLRVCVPQILRLIVKVMPGTDGPDWKTVSRLFASPDALHRAEVARLMSRHGLGVRAQLTRLVVADDSALVRREALFGLVRLGATSEVRGLLRGTPLTELDRSAWIVAAAVVGDIAALPLQTPYEQLLDRASREHRPHEL